ncbi:sigma-70 family RNA polymerase sigma factor [Solibacillus silvestris]|uniref:sigma-70 family RNA polymerase sigma factor n=1 Tax=Solibacillus silvestris TaxID=76853 RepID=UPI003F802880
MDEQQLTILMNRHTAKLFRIAYYYSKNLHTAEDIVQDVFIKFYEKNIELDADAIERYLIVMTSNKSKDYLKSWHYQKLVLQEKWLHRAGRKMQDAFIIKDEEEMISEAVLSLPIKQREVVAYYYLEGYSIAELSEILRLNENTAKSRLVKGRNLLREKLSSIEWEVLKNDTL